MEKTQIKNSEVMAFALPTAVSALVFLIPMMYGMMFMTEYLGISAAAMGTAMLVTRLLDYVVAIFAGSIIEKTKSKKHGKYALWLRITTFTVFFGSLLQLVDTSGVISSSFGRLIFVSIFYCSLHFGMNFRATSQGGLMQKIAGTSMEARKMLNARLGQASAAVTIISGALTIPLIQFFARQFGEAYGYVLAVVTFGVLFMVLTLTMQFPLMKKYDLPREDAEVKNTPPLKDMFKSIITNKQMVILFLMVTFMTIGTQIFTPLLAYYFNVVTGNFGMMTLLLTAQGIGSFLFSLVAPTIANKLGKKGAFVFTSALSIFCYVGIWMFGLNNLWVLIVLATLSRSAYSIYRCFQYNYFLDCGEYGYYSTGQDNRTMALTVMNWPVKVGFLAGGTAVGYGLAFIGYSAGMEVTAEFASNFMRLFGLVPAALFIVTLVIAVFGYKLSDEKAAFYANENNKREAATQEA